MVMEGCFWYTVFNWMGCMDNETEQVRTQAAPPPPPSNPFTHTGLPKNPHLLPAYN